MGHTDHKTLPAGRVAARWFLFLVFFHLLPVPWFLIVAGGLAPASFLFAIGVTGLFITDFDSLPMAVMFLGPALTSGLVFVLLAYQLALALHKNPASEFGSDTSSRYWLERAAEQGHIEAAMALARSPRSAKDKLRWLTVGMDNVPC